MHSVNLLCDSISVDQFDLGATLDSGQVFRWECIDGWYVGVLRDAVVRLRQSGETLQIESSTERVDATVIRQFLGLNEDWAAICLEMQGDEHVRRALSRFPGLRVLRQDPWECLSAFILSSCNNIQRIRGMIDRTAQRYGQTVSANGYQRRQWPTPEQLAAATASDLRALGLGYRAEYLRDSAQYVTEHPQWLLKLADAPTDDVRARLQELPGVGVKVAECVTLFAYGRLEAFPIDTWIRQTLQRHYFRGERRSDHQLQMFAADHFGQYAGYAQQYLYHAARLEGHNAKS